jgi:hypothetical protein
MNRRDLILGSALGLAAAGAAAQAQAQTGAKAAGSGGAKVPSQYGQVAEIAFTTSADLQAFMPPGLTVLDPHKAFIKAERIKIRSTDADGMPAAFNHVDRVCIATMAQTPQFGVRQRNILVWANRGWAIPGAEMGVNRYADIHMPNIFDIDYAIAEQGGLVPFYVNVFAGMTQLMAFSGKLDAKTRTQHIPYPGFYTGGEPGQDLMAMDLAASEFSLPLGGTGTLNFGQQENRLTDRKVAAGGTAPFQTNAPAGPGKGWPPSLLKDVEVQGVLFQEFSVTQAQGSEFHLVRKALPGNGRSRF